MGARALLLSHLLFLSMKEKEKEKKKRTRRGAGDIRQQEAERTRQGRPPPSGLDPKRPHLAVNTESDRPLRESSWPTDSRDACGRSVSHTWLIKSLRHTWVRQSRGSIPARHMVEAHGAVVAGV